MVLLIAFTASAWAQDPQMTLLGTYQVPGAVFDAGAAEIPAYHPASQRVFFTDAYNDELKVLDISNPASPVKEDALILSGGPNSVAVHGDLVAVAVEAEIKQNPGKVEFYNANTLVKLGEVTVGALPDMVVFTKDGSYLLVANEGEPSADYLNDPEGSVSIIRIPSDIGTISGATVTTAGFSSYNAEAAALIGAGVRIYGPGASVAQDMEPEYITTVDGIAYVSCQENNALAIVDIATATVTDILPLGYKDHSLSANALDASNDDGMINITTWPVRGFYMPDAISSYTIGGVSYIVTANEGDSRDYDGYSEEVRVKDVVLDAAVFPEAATLQLAENLGRLKITTAQGDDGNDGDFEALYSYGARSFSIWTTDGALVWDSGDDFEQRLASLHAEFFNASNDENAFDDRSDDKGPEPEGLVLAEVGDKVYAFIGLERTGGIMLYDITDPSAPVYLDYINNRDFNASQADLEAGLGGDLGPEGIAFIDATDSPNGKPLLVVTNEISGTVSIYEVENIETTTGIADEITSGLRSYPNPAAKNIHLSAQYPIGTAQVWGHNGQLLLEVSNDQINAHMQIDLSSLEAGLYLIRAFSPEQKPMGLIKVMHHR